MAKILISDIGTRRISPEGYPGDESFAVKANVTNNTQDVLKYNFVLQGVDSEGYLVTEVNFTGELKPGESDTVTEQVYVWNGHYSRIARWKVKPSG